MKKILVIGSLNMDTVIETSQMPRIGETISGKSVTLVPGGKGANQGYAVGSLGGCVKMIGAVGQDSFGQLLISNLKSVGVDVANIHILDGISTGQAFITVDNHGENSIIIVSGANAKVDKMLIQNHINLIEESDIIVLQLEIPFETVKYVKDIAVKLGKTVILDPAPAISEVNDNFWEGIDYIKPNETELSILSGFEIKDMDQLSRAARKMLEKGVKNVIVTMGGKGCYLVTKDYEEFFPAHEVIAIDTTAAGDSFTAAFAVALSQGKDIKAAINFGQKVSSIVVTKKGAQTSIPRIDELNDNLV